MEEFQAELERKASEVESEVEGGTLNVNVIDNS